MTMSNLEELLYSVFSFLRRQGVPIGISEYLLALKLIREYACLDSLADLKNICRLLWVKSLEDQELFDATFERTITPALRAGSKQKIASQPSITRSDHPQQGEFIDDPPLGAVTDLDSEIPSIIKEVEVTVSTEVIGIEPKGKKITPNYSPTNEQEIAYNLIPQLPFDWRELSASWRHLRLLKREGPPEDLDVEGTINLLCQTGIFLRPAFQPRRRNSVRILLLVDQLGSMVPFSLHIKAVIESMLRGGLLGKLTIYYFHDCPKDFLYDNPNLTGAHPIETVLATQAKGSSVVILSDAGAARGNYEGKRFYDTRSFLKSLNSYTYLYVWLNPAPPDRWLSTTAEDISRLAPMFPLDRNGIIDAVNILRGHPFPLGITLDMT